jgi:hypothetical protein
MPARDISELKAGFVVGRDQAISTVWLHLRKMRALRRQVNT